jgi:hypothetical protein
MKKEYNSPVISCTVLTAITPVLGASWNNDPYSGGGD